jgi:hypothetical protein
MMTVDLLGSQVAERTKCNNYAHNDSKLRSAVKLAPHENSGEGTPTPKSCGLSQYRAQVQNKAMLKVD